jgi:hypothetical protein
LYQAVSSRVCRCWWPDLVAGGEDEPVPVRAALGAGDHVTVQDERLLPGHHPTGELVVARHTQLWRKEIVDDRYRSRFGGCPHLGPHPFDLRRHLPLQPNPHLVHLGRHLAGLRRAAAPAYPFKHLGGLPRLVLLAS